MRIRAAFVTPGAFAIPSPMGGSVERVVEKVVPKLVPYVDARIYGRVGKTLSVKGKLGDASIERFSGANKDRYFNEVCRRLASFKPHVIQVENRPQWVPKLKRLFPDARVWLNMHSTTFISRRYLSPKERNRCLKAADTIQVNSEFIGSYIKRNVPYTGGKIKVNHLGVDAERFHGRSSPEGARLRESGRAARGWTNRKIILFVGRLIPQKGVHHLLSALPSIVSAYPDSLLVVVGSARYGSHRRTAYAKKLHAQARRLRKHVHFEPYVPHGEIPGWFAMADLAVVPSVGKEAFGLVNAEAMAAELPVVATRAGGIAEVVEDGTTGYLVSPKPTEIARELSDRIRTLLGDERLRLAMGRSGRARVMERFLWDHTAVRWLDSQAEQF